MSEFFKILLSGLSVLFTLIAFFPYIKGILKGTISAHIFSWIIWGTTTTIAFAAQYADEGGWGAWPTGASGMISFGIAVLAFFKREKVETTVVDWTFFLGALVSIPIWAFTSDPLWAVIVLTVVDLLGFGPTLRKAYKDPMSESLSFFAWFILRNLLSVAALENFSLTTMLFPLAMSLGCLYLIVMVGLRRRKISSIPE